MEILIFRQIYLLISTTAENNLMNANLVIKISLKLFRSKSPTAEASTRKIS